MSILVMAGLSRAFVKGAPVFAALEARDLDTARVHAGLRYGELRSDVFCLHLGLLVAEASA